MRVETTSRRSDPERIGEDSFRAEASKAVEQLAGQAAACPLPNQPIDALRSLPCSGGDLHVGSVDGGAVSIEAGTGGGDGVCDGRWRRTAGNGAHLDEAARIELVGQPGR